MLGRRFRGRPNESTDGNSGGAVLVSSLEGGGGFLNLALPGTEEKDRLRVCFGAGTSLPVTEANEKGTLGEGFR